jgi:hypothetical protein
VSHECKRQLTIVYELRYRLTEMELISGLVLKNGRRRRTRDGDLKVSDIANRHIDTTTNRPFDRTR